MTLALPSGYALPSIPEIAARAGYDPIAWHHLRTRQQARIIARLYDAQARGAMGKSLGATNIAASEIPRLADEAGEGLWQSDFRNAAATSAWWSKVTKTGPGPWDIQLVFQNGGSMLRSLQRMLSDGIRLPWKMRYSGGEMNSKPLEATGAFNEATCAALYAYAATELPRMGMPAADVTAKLANIDAAGNSRTVTQDVLILCVLLTYYRPWANNVGAQTKFLPAPLGELTYAGLALPTNPDVNVKMLQLPTDVQSWVWGQFYTDVWTYNAGDRGTDPAYPVAANIPLRRLSPWMLGADGKLVMRTGAEPIKPGQLPPYIPAEVYLPYQRTSGGLLSGLPSGLGGIALVAAVGAGLYFAFGDG